MQLGEIYKADWDSRPYRIIGFDEIEVFYDVHDYADKWLFSGNFKKKCSFYRTSSPLFAERSALLRCLPFTEEEQQFFRPDLPQRFGRSLLLSWNSFPAQNHDEYLLFLAQNQIDFSTKIDIPELVLLPSGNAGSLKKAGLITADNGLFFTAAEVVWKAKNLQEAANKKTSQGIGIYRLGFEKGLPSYYIGEYIDQAGLLK